MMLVSAFTKTVAQAEAGLCLRDRALGPRKRSTYRYARRNEAKGFRKEAKGQGVRWPGDRAK